MIERLILPKYPTLKIKGIDSYKLTNKTEYDVYFLTKKKLSQEDQMTIDTQIKSFFKMAGLDIIEKNRTQKNNILVWFKTPKSREWTFHASPGYIHN